MAATGTRQSMNSHRSTSKSTNVSSSARLAIAVLLGTGVWPDRVRAGEAEGIRPYLHWRVGEFAPAWDVLDLRGISFGADLDRRWSVELALDAWQLDLEAVPSVGPLGEQQIITLAPQARFRVPVWRDRLVLYGIAGVGGAWIQFNDRKRAGIPYAIDADGLTLEATAGVGFDLFLADNIAFNLEGRYAWLDPINIRIDGARQDWDASSFLATMGFRIYFDRNHAEAPSGRAGDRRVDSRL